MNIEEIKDIASGQYTYKIKDECILIALRIRLVEEAFLELFSAGKMNGTVHTCIGQEFSAVALASQLSNNDWVTSNHRCHGHFIAKTNNWKGLIDELLGNINGVCSGIGSSQHLYANGFISNGIQGSLLPVGTGISLHAKLNNLNSIVVSFIGEGTLGEGIVYESFNLASLYQVPQLIVCENNFYSQSTPQVKGVTGEIIDRPKAFGIKTFEANTWNLESLFEIVKDAVNYVRSGYPAFLNICTYRLNAHSKGDDNRPSEEINYFIERDVLTQLLKQKYWAEKSQSIKTEIQDYIKTSSSHMKSMDYSKYCIDQLPRHSIAELENVSNPKIRMQQALNTSYLNLLSGGAFIIGEDICDPYGGAFKITRGFSSAYPNQVFGSPISEAGIMGLAIGMALMGVQSYVEIMFGDFVTLGFDQILNNASKMHHMYALQVNVPLRIRTPMGGKRGYGPTHSQSLEKFFVGMDNIAVIALSSLLDPSSSLSDLNEIKCPVFIVENKLDYGKFLWSDTNQYSLMREKKIFGGCLLTPKFSKPTLTVVSYGETARHIADNLELFFEETDQVVELVSLTRLHPIDMTLINRSLEKTKSILIVEDGSKDFGIGAEILSGLLENRVKVNFAKRIGAEPYPIPSASDLEMNLLPTIKKIIPEFLSSFKGKRND